MDESLVKRLQKVSTDLPAREVVQALVRIDPRKSPSYPWELYREEMKPGYPADAVVALDELHKTIDKVEETLKQYERKEIDLEMRDVQLKNYVKRAEGDFDYFWNEIANVKTRLEKAKQKQPQMESKESKNGHSNGHGNGRKKRSTKKSKRKSHW